MIATDVAARGLDIRALPYVVNYDFPSRLETYIHRVGRTGRLAANGHAFSFFTRNLVRGLACTGAQEGSNLDCIWPEQAVEARHVVRHMYCVIFISIEVHMNAIVQQRPALLLLISTHPRPRTSPYA